MIVVFTKSMALRHIGHLDLMRAMQRALRRSNLPIRYSNGFNPHIQLSFAAPLTVGVVGLRELMDVPVEGECDPDVFLKTLNQALPAALPALSARPVGDDFPSLMALTSGSRYRVELDENADTAKLSDALATFMAAETCVALRKTKSGEKPTDIRPFVADAKAEGPTLRFTIRNRKEGSLKPRILMGALFELAKMEPIPCIAYRETILTNGKDGEAIPLEEYDDA